MLVRRIARPLFATWFVAEGVEALRSPGPHVARTEEAWRRLKGRLDLPEAPPSSQLTTLAKVHGAAMAGAGIMLAIGKAPRTAAVVLAALTLPLAVVNEPFTAEGTSADVTRDRFLRNLTMIGGALLAAVDLEGRPGLAWRASHARVHRAASREAKAAITAAIKDSKALAKEAKSSAKEARALAKAAQQAA
jgi:uncharacterized membrane protein YphA (DoxX/SURF4 family)